MFWRRRKSRDDELDREIRSHLELEAEEQQGNGLSPEEARYAAKRALGNATQIKESVRATWRWTGCEHLIHDVRYAVRLLLKTPVLTGVAVLSLALGIGANTAIFSAINALMLRMLPIPDPQQLVSIGALDPQHPQYGQGVSLAMFHQVQQHTSVFSNVFVWTGGAVRNVEIGGANYPGTVDGASGDYFAALGIHPVLGRLLKYSDAPLDGRPSARVAVLSYGCWQNHFGGDPHVLGKTIRISGIPLTVVGVSPPNFVGLIIDNSPEATIPIGYSHRALKYRETRPYHLYGRLKPDITISQARAQLRALWPAILKATVPNSFHGRQRLKFFSLRPNVQTAAYGNSFLRRDLERPLEILMALMGAVLLIACLNLANLLSARGITRRHELSVRVALGARRWPLMRMLLSEALLLSCTGATLGILIARGAGSYLVQSFWTGDVPFSFDVSLDLRVLFFTIALAVFTGILFGIVPAWQMSRCDPARTLSQSARTTGGRSGRLSRALMIAQISLSLVLLIGATLFVRSLQNLKDANLGYHRKGLLMMQLFHQPGLQTIPNRTAYFHELATRLSQIPGVVSASYLDMGPATGYDFKVPVSITAGTVANAVEDWAGPGIFHTLGMHVIAGREFTWRDNAKAPRVAIISESLAKALFPGQNPIGRVINVGSPELHRHGLKIVGVVNSASLWRFDSRKPLAIFNALMQEAEFTGGKAIVRTTGNPVAIAHTADRIVSSLGSQYVLKSETLKQRTDETLVNQRMIALLASGFSLLALLLAAIGLYGVMSYAVTRRTTEIGIRMALGAMRTDVLRMILGEVLLLIFVGIAIALPIAFACNKFISGMLFGVSAADPVVVIVACSILIAVALFAGLLPARRAARVDPMTALRYE